MPTANISEEITISDTTWEAVAGPGYVLLSNLSTVNRITWAWGTTAPSESVLHVIELAKSGVDSQIAFTIPTGVSLYVKKVPSANSDAVTAAFTAENPL